MAVLQRIARRRASAMPLSEFPADKQKLILKQIQAPKPPPRWIYFGDPDSGPGPIAAIESRAWYEWHWERGIEPGEKRDKLPENLRLAVIERDGYTCQLCRGEVEPSDLHIDHIKPYSKGGTHALGNLQVTHSMCNLRKGAAYNGED